MSRKKIEIHYPIHSSNEEEETEKETDTHHSEEQPKSLTITTSSNAMYSEEMLFNRIEETGMLDDYISGQEIMSRSQRWMECFSKDDLIQIFTQFPAVYERCKAHMSKTLGSTVLSIPLFNDTFCNLFEDVLKKAKAVHLHHHWGFSENTAKFHQFELAISLLYSFLEEDSLASSKKEPSICNALNAFAESSFVKLDKIEAQALYSQLRNITRGGHCSAGFADKLSRVYTSLTLARAVLFYGNVLQKQRHENTKEHKEGSYGWDYRQSASFFKMKPQLKKEMESPLYHGDIDTEAAKRLLNNPGDYLARYSSNRNQYYFTILLHANEKYFKVVLNWEIPSDKCESWITSPMANREEIELFLKDNLLIAQRHNKLVQHVDRFLENEHYSPVFNPLSNMDILNAFPRAG